jgi:D-alanyl-D-alanine carboxypeptidase/D-alanyl-D-alanine-endopeptidase (penicillin-binding protein 4)
MIVGARKYVLSWWYIILACVNLVAYDINHIQRVVHDIVQSHNDMSIGIKAVSLVHGKELCAIHEHCRFIPASNTKLFTAIAALECLGPDYRFETYLLTDGTVEGTVLHGSLYLKASGDPSLTAADLTQLMTVLHNHGVTEVTGNLWIDMAEFDNDIFPTGSCIDNIGYAWNAPVTLFSIDGKAACVELLRGGSLVSDEKFMVSVVDANALMRQIFEATGIRFHGSVNALYACDGNSANLTMLAVHHSEPLSQLIKVMMKDSNNLYADCIFKKIASAVSGSQGSWKQGYHELKALMERIGINPQELVIMDGAGRSRYNLVSPSHIIILLQWAYKQPYFPHFLESLSIAGTDGTLKERMKDLSPCIRGKTGTLSGVSALCGYVILPDDIVAFSILVNGFVSSSTYTPPCKSEVEDAFCCCLASADNDESI